MLPSGFLPASTRPWCGWSWASASGSETGADIAGVRAVLAVLVAIRLEGGPAAGAGVGSDGAPLQHHRVGVPPGHAAGPAAKPLPAPRLVNSLSAVLADPIRGCASGVWGDVVAPAP